MFPLKPEGIHVPLVAGVDYLHPLPSTLSFGPDTTTGSSQCSTIMALQDPDVEGNHSLLLSLVNATAGTEVGPLGNTLVTITDDGQFLASILYSAPYVVSIVHI